MSHTMRLTVPRTKLKTYGDRAFSVQVPVLWNNLPQGYKCQTASLLLNQALKHFYFVLCMGNSETFYLPLIYFNTVIWTFLINLFIFYSHCLSTEEHLYEFYVLYK